MIHGTAILSLVLLTSLAFRLETVVVLDPSIGYYKLQGGSPHVRLVGKETGTITRAEWNSAAAPDVEGCPMGTTIVEIMVCWPDSISDEACLKCKGGHFSPEMKSKVAQLPDGTLFSLEVVVAFKGEMGLAKGKVPPAAFTITN